MFNVNWRRELNKLHDNYNSYYISHHPDLTWDIIQANPDYKWNWCNISAHPNITWDVI